MVPLKRSLAEAPIDLKFSGCAAEILVSLFLQLKLTNNKRPSNILNGCKDLEGIG